MFLFQAVLKLYSQIAYKSNFRCLEGFSLLRQPQAALFRRPHMAMAEEASKGRFRVWGGEVKGDGRFSYLVWPFPLQRKLCHLLSPLCFSCSQGWREVLLDSRHVVPLFIFGLPSCFCSWGVLRQIFANNPNVKHVSNETVQTALASIHSGIWANGRCLLERSSTSPFISESFPVNLCFLENPTLPAKSAVL